MDPKIFKEQLEQLAEIRDRKPVRNSGQRPAIEYITEIDEFGEEYSVPVEIKHNDTLGFELVKLRDQHKICELGCGDVVTNQVIQKRLCSSPKPHWRTRCDNCSGWQNPTSTGIIKGAHAIQNAYVEFFNLNKKSSKSHVSQMPEIPDTPDIPGEPRTYSGTEDGRDYTETTTNHSIIRRYK